MVKNLIPEKELILLTEFNEFKGSLFGKKNEKNFRQKNIKWEHTKSTKYHYHVLVTKDLF